MRISTARNRPLAPDSVVIMMPDGQRVDMPARVALNLLPPTVSTGSVSGKAPRLCHGTPAQAVALCKGSADAHIFLA